MISGKQAIYALEKVSFFGLYASYKHINHHPNDCVCMCRCRCVEDLTYPTFGGTFQTQDQLIGGGLSNWGQKPCPKFRRLIFGSAVKVMVRLRVRVRVRVRQVVVRVSL